MARLWPVLIISSILALFTLFLTSHQLGHPVSWPSSRLIPSKWLPIQDYRIYEAHLSTDLATSNMVDILNRTLGVRLSSPTIAMLF